MIFCFLICVPSFSKDKIEWTKEYKLTLEDFKSPTTEINEGVSSRIYYSGANMDFLFQMSNIEFMLTKNFNEKVTAFYNRNAATIIAPNSTIARQLLAVANYDFDLTELFCRKFRKELFDNKGAFSNVSFFRPIFEKIHSEILLIWGAWRNKIKKGKNTKLPHGRL